MNRNRASLSGVRGGCPWRPLNKTYNSKSIIALHEEIEDFFHYMSPNPEEHNLRSTVVKQITATIKQLWPFAKVEVFGSFRTGLYLPTSDIDMIVIGDWEKLPLRTLQEAIVKNNICDEQQVKVIDKATVPLVKFTDKRYDIKVDISFNMNNGVQASELIKNYMQQYPALAKLVLVLKQFLLERNLNEVFHGGISSYSLILMTVSFLQVHRRDGVNLASANLGVLLIEFFELYGRQFNYLNTAIRVNGNGAYMGKMHGQIMGTSPSMLTIEDPLNPDNDIGRGSYGAVYVKRAFEYAFVTLTQAVNPHAQTYTTKDNNESILGRIVRVSNKVVEYRRWIKESFPLTQSNNERSSSGSDGSLSSSDSESEYSEAPPPPPLQQIP